MVENKNPPQESNYVSQIQKQEREPVNYSYLSFKLSRILKLSNCDLNSQVSMKITSKKLNPSRINRELVETKSRRTEFYEKEKMAEKMCTENRVARVKRKDFFFSFPFFVLNISGGK